MFHTQVPKYPQILHIEVIKSFNKLTSLMQDLKSPEFTQHCRIWKIDEGAKKLLQLAIESDRFFTKQAHKMKKASVDDGLKVINKKKSVEKSKSEQKLKSKLIEVKQEERSPKSIRKALNWDLKIEQEVIHEEDAIFEQFQQSNNQIKYEEIRKQDSCIDEQDDMDQSKYKPLLMFQKNKIKTNDNKVKKYLRGPYKNYSKDMKAKMVELYRSNETSISKLSLQFGVPIKNIKRWAQNGVERKQGAGRKRLDPQMQNQLFESIISKYGKGSELQLQDIRCIALTLSKYQEFKASKGWIVSFVERFKLSEIYKIK